MNIKLISVSSTCQCLKDNRKIKRIKGKIFQEGAGDFVNNFAEASTVVRVEV
jgi:hypothetical protein